MDARRRRLEPVVLLVLTCLFKDMLMALIGSLTAQLLFARLHDRQIAETAPAAPPPRSK